MYLSIMDFHRSHHDEASVGKSVLLLPPRTQHHDEASVGKLMLLLPPRTQYQVSTPTFKHDMPQTIEAKNTFQGHPVQLSTQNYVNSPVNILNYLRWTLLGIIDLF